MLTFWVHIKNVGTLWHFVPASLVSYHEVHVFMKNNHGAMIFFLRSPGRWIPVEAAPPGLPQHQAEDVGDDEVLERPEGGVRQARAASSRGQGPAGVQPEVGESWEMDQGEG